MMDRRFWLLEKVLTIMANTVLEDLREFGVVCVD